MAPGKYSRMDNRRSPGYCSTVTVVVFVALCLVGVWMMASSSLVPVQNSTVSRDNRGEVETLRFEGNSDTRDNEKNNISGEVKPKQFEDNQGDLPEDAIKEDLERNDIPEEVEKRNENLSGGVENKEDEAEIGEQKNDGGEPQKENTSSEPVETMENNSDKMEEKLENKNPEQSEVFPSVAHSELLNESTTGSGSFPTQADQSENENASRNQTWKVCKTTAGADYIPCLDNYQAIKKLKSNKHFEHRERHCPENPPTCLVPMPKGYKRSIQWPKSRERIWYHNVPHPLLVQIKGHQNWVRISGEYLTFPGGGTQFMYGALHYIDRIQQSVPEIAWGKHSRVVLDVGCGVASFGGYLFDRDVLTMSLAPKDEHEAQVQLALERGIPAISAVMGTMRLPFPGRVFDIVHCARCRVPWHIDGGKLLLELNRLLRPGGFFVWSATPIYQKLPEDVKIWEEMKKLTKAICWEVISITKDRLNKVGIAVYRKPSTNECYEQRPTNAPPLCKDSDDLNAAWNVPLEGCIHKLSAPSERGSQWPEEWPTRVEKAPFWLSSLETGVYGKAAPDDFVSDYEYWKSVVKNTYLSGLGIKWVSVRNVMDMRAVYGGLAAALRELDIWVMNIVSTDTTDTLPIIFDRGLFGMYHDWCESFSTYPRTYDLLHADHLFSKIKTNNKCNFMALVAEVDRILRPGGNIIIRDKLEILNELKDLFKSLKWDTRMVESKTGRLIFANKSTWRPKAEETLPYATES